jgi:hypothetical protein
LGNKVVGSYLKQVHKANETLVQDIVSRCDDTKKGINDNIMEMLMTQREELQEIKDDMPKEQEDRYEIWILIGAKGLISSQDNSFQNFPEDIENKRWRRYRDY